MSGVEFAVDVARLLGAGLACADIAITPTKYRPPLMQLLGGAL